MIGCYAALKSHKVEISIVSRMQHLVSGVMIAGAVVGVIFCVWGAYDIWFAIFHLTSEPGLDPAPDDPENYATLVFGVKLTILTTIGVVSIFLADGLRKKQARITRYSQ